MRLLVLAAALALAGCGGAARDDGRLSVVATTTQLGDAVREIAGPGVVVHQILRPNTDPHEYELRPRDVKETARAALVVESGAGLDAWMRDVRHEAGGDAAVLTVAPAHIPDRIAGDPHWWHDPRNMAAAATAIGAALARADRAHAAAYGAGARRYAARVRGLDRAIAGCLSRVPPDRRKLVTGHDAFGYFARRYGIRVVGAVFPANTAEAQPSAGEISRLADVVRREHVTAVFPESSVNRRLAEALARETGARADLTLYGDTLGPRGSPGATYLGMERANADAIASGLMGRGCPAS